MNLEILIEKLRLKRHPEGGYFKESYRSSLILSKSFLPEVYPGSRSFCTAIYYCLPPGEFSSLHRIKSDEIWHFYGGNPIVISIIFEDGEMNLKTLGPSLGDGESHQVVVPAGCWFGALPKRGSHDYSLVGCTVSPGFDFLDFEMGERDSLIRQYPKLTETIRTLTRGKS